MKKLLNLIVVLFLAQYAISQVPNPGFENWTDMGGYENPDRWGNLNSSTSSSGIYTVTKGTTAPASGLAFVKLTTKDISGIITPGIIVSGELDNSTYKPLSGFAYTGRPEKLKGKWQYMGYGTDVSTIAGYLTKWSNSLQQRDTIASLLFNTSGMLHAWSSFSLPFVYRSSSIPDTAVIWISSSWKNPVKNSFIWIDDLSFDGTVTSIALKVKAMDFNIYPNPASDYLRISLNVPAEQELNILLIDNIGNPRMNLIESVSAGDNILNLDLSSPKIHPGVYFLQVKTPDAVYARKLIIRK